MDGWRGRRGWKRSEATGLQLVIIYHHHRCRRRRRHLVCRHRHVFVVNILAFIDPEFVLYNTLLNLARHLYIYIYNIYIYIIYIYIVYIYIYIVFRLQA